MSETEDLSDQFFIQLSDMCSRLGCEPLDMLSVMFSESGVSAIAVNPHSDASGLIQFMPRTLEGLGWTKGTESFRGLTAEQQLVWVESFFEQWKAKGLSNVARLYQAVFLPGSLDVGSSDDTVICGRNGPFSAAYESNRNVDKDKKGHISVADLRRAIEERTKGKRWFEILTRLKSLENQAIEVLLEENDMPEVIKDPDSHRHYLKLGRGMILIPNAVLRKELVERYGIWTPTKDLFRWFLESSR